MIRLFPILLLSFVTYFVNAQVTSIMNNDNINVTSRFDGDLISSSEVTALGLSAFDVKDRANVMPTLIEVFQSSPLIGSYMQKDEIGFYDDTDFITVLDNQQLAFVEDLGFLSISRMSLTNSGLTFLNGGAWTSIRLSNSGTAGKLELMAGGGTGEIFEVGPDADATQGQLLLKRRNTTKAKLDIFSEGGFLQTYGRNNSSNAGVGFPSGRPDVGYVYAQDDNGQIQAGMIVNADGTGSIFADTKNFRIPHPEKSEHEIWYASLEGPEAGAYERGTAELENGRVFVPFSEHFQLVVNHQTMTVQLTPRYSDTYGLAVVKVTKKGFWVEELKNGGGSFAFDWNATAVRKGHEEYRVIRHASEMAAASDEEVEALANANNSVEEANDTDDLDTPTNEVQQQAVKSSFLKANRPNPFSRSTSIDYQLPAEVSNATLIVTDANGKAIQEHQLSSGTGTVEIDATNLPKGIYNYSLVLDGQIQETQRMILQ